MPWDVIGTWSKWSCGALKGRGTPKFHDQFPNQELGIIWGHKNAPFPGKPWLSSPQGGLPSLSLLESVESGNPKRCRKVNHHWFRRILPFYIFLRGAVMQLRSEGVWSSLHSAAQKSANSLVQHRCFFEHCILWTDHVFADIVFKKMHHRFG